MSKGCKAFGDVESTPFLSFSVGESLFTLPDQLRTKDTVKNCVTFLPCVVGERGQAGVWGVWFDRRVVVLPGVAQFGLVFGGGGGFSLFSAPTRPA